MSPDDQTDETCFEFITKSYLEIIKVIEFIVRNHSKTLLELYYKMDKEIEEEKR